MEVFEGIHDIVTKQLLRVTKTKWEDRLFEREELYRTSFDVEQLILNVFSENYIHSLHQVLSVIFEHSSVYFLRFFSMIPSSGLKNYLTRGFLAQIKGFRHSERSNFVHLKLVNFRLPFILPRFEGVAKQVESLRDDFRSNLRSLAQFRGDQQKFDEQVSAWNAKYQSFQNCIYGSGIYEIENTDLGPRHKRLYFDYLLRDLALYFTDASVVAQAPAARGPATRDEEE